MFQKIQDVLKKQKHDKKGQSVIELAVGLMLTMVLLTVMFDFAVIIQTKTETMMIARNAVRRVLIKGISPTDGNKNVQNANEAKALMRSLYAQNHFTSGSQKFVSWDEVDSKVYNTPHANTIKNGNTGKNPVYAEACEVTHPMTLSVFRKRGIKICSSYTGSHSSQSR